MINPEVLKAISGNGLTAGDYAGLTPEQINMVAGHGQQDRSQQLGLVMNMQQNEMAERKQQFDEMHADRTFQLMQNQEIRQRYQMLIDTGFKAASHQLQQKQLGLEEMKTNAAIATDKVQQEKLQLEIDAIKRQQSKLELLDKTYVETPFASVDGNNKMSLGALLAGGQGLTEIAYKYAAAKNLKGAGGGLGGTGLGLGLGVGGDDSNAEQVRAIQTHMWMKKGLTLEAATIMSTMGGTLTTPEKTFEALQKDPQFNILSDDQKRQKAVMLAEAHNDWAVQTYTGNNVREWQALQQEVLDEAKRKQQEAQDAQTKTKPAETPAATPTPSSSMNVQQLEQSLTESEMQNLQKQYPAWFEYSDVYKKKVLKPNAVLLIGSELAGRSSQFASDASKNIGMWVEELMRSDPEARKQAGANRAKYMKGVVNR